SLHDLGLVATEEGDHGAARRLQEESLAIRRQLGDHLSIAASLHDLGLTAYRAEEYEAARAFHEEGLAIRRAIEDRGGIAASLEALAALACEGHGQPGAGERAGARLRQVEAAGSAAMAARLFGAAAALRESIGTPVP